MMTDNLKASPQTLEEVGLALTSKIQNKKLTVHGSISKDGTQDIGELTDFKGDLEDFQELIQDHKNVKVFPIDDNLIKIKVGGIPIQLIQRPKKQTLNYTDTQTETVKQLLKTQSSMEKQIKQNTEELQQQKTLINALQMTFNHLKQTIKLEVSSQHSLKQTVANLSSQTQKRLTEKIEQNFDTRYKELQQFVKKEKSQKLCNLNENKMEEMRKQINELKKQINELKFNLEDEMSNSLKIGSVSELEKHNSQEKMQQNAKKKQMIKLALNKKFESVYVRLEANSIVIDGFRNQLRKQNDEIKKTSITVTQLDQKVKKHETQITTTNCTVAQQSERLKQNENQIKTIKNYSQSRSFIPLSKYLQFLNGLQVSRLNEPIKSCKWSEQLKSKQITINNKVVSKTTKTGQWEFCLLNSSFSNTLKSKQSWTIKINKMQIYAIYLGVCLKSKIIKYNFNSQNIQWGETGHGLYMIGAGGQCYSHSEKEFNNVQKSFKFGFGDVIYIEYDPINKKLRFNKNKVDYFELSMIEPPQNDAYHPCVSIRGQNDSIELIQPK